MTLICFPVTVQLYKFQLTICSSRRCCYFELFKKLRTCDSNQWKIPSNISFQQMFDDYRKCQFRLIDALRNNVTLILIAIIIFQEMFVHAIKRFQ